MNIHQLIESMAKLLKLHKSLLELVLRKTGILEAEDVTGLTELLKEEQAHILAIEKVEAERSRIAENKTLSEILVSFPDEEREYLAGISSELKDLMAKIKEQNALNQHLISQTLKYISFSMSLVKPPQDDYNYGENVPNGASKSLFNSKA